MAGRSMKQGTHDVKLSKALSYYLRHGAKKVDLDITPGGYVKVNDLLRLERLQQYNVGDVRRVVENNDKQRFALMEDETTSELMIKANQGHTIPIEDLDLVEVDPTELPVAVHGTFSGCIQAIKKDGLSKMRRQHIHLATGLPGESGVISGMRKSCDFLVYVDVKKAVEDGIKFYRSPNNVILCSGNEAGYIPPKYFDRIERR